MGKRTINWIKWGTIAAIFLCMPVVLEWNGILVNIVRTPAAQAISDAKITYLQTNTDSFITEQRNYNFRIEKDIGQIKEALDIPQYMVYNYTNGMRQRAQQDTPTHNN